MFVYDNCKMKVLWNEDISGTSLKQEEALDRDIGKYFRKKKELGMFRNLKWVYRLNLRKFVPYSVFEDVEKDFYKDYFEDLKSSIYIDKTYKWYHNELNFRLYNSIIDKYKSYFSFEDIKNWEQLLRVFNSNSESISKITDYKDIKVSESIKNSRLKRIEDLIKDYKKNRYTYLFNLFYSFNDERLWFSDYLYDNAFKNPELYDYDILIWVNNKYFILMKEEEWQEHRDFIFRNVSEKSVLWDIYGFKNKNLIEYNEKIEGEKLYTFADLFIWWQVQDYIVPVEFTESFYEI